MDIRCDECGHAGEAARVEPVDEGVKLYCAECGHGHVVSAGDEVTGGREEDGHTETDDDVAEDIDEVDKVVSRAVHFVGSSVDSLENLGEGDTPEGPTFEIGDDFIDELVRHLIPESGDGQRCRKCLTLFDEPVEHCPECGLSVAEAESHPEGEAPWEQPPDSREKVLRRAEELWEQVTRRDDEAAAIEEFVDYVVDERLVDYGIRMLQKRVIDRGVNDAIRGGLARLAKALQVDVEVARSQAEAKADEFTDEVQRARMKFMVGALIFWTVLFLLFTWLFWL